MKNQKPLYIAIGTLVVVILAVLAVRYSTESAPTLVVLPDSSIGVIGTITAREGNVITVRDLKSPGHAAPLVFTFVVGTSTVMTKVAAADYATSTATLADLTVGALVNVSGGRANADGTRPIEALILPPQ